MFKKFSRSRSGSTNQPSPSRVALVLIYNHQYNENIEKLEAIYGPRFDQIYHLVPFYEGDRPNVIPVYEKSHYFQGYIAQAFSSFFSAHYDHYLFVADDLLLNPLREPRPQPTGRFCLHFDPHWSSGTGKLCRPFFQQSVHCLAVIIRLMASPLIGG